MSRSAPERHDPVTHDHWVDDDRTVGQWGDGSVRSEGLRPRPYSGGYGGGRTITPRGSGLPPALPTIPTIVVAATAVIAAFVLGHSTAGSGDSTPVTTPEVAVVTTTTPTTVATTTYTVVKGDTLASIADKNGVTAEALATANAITDPSLIFVGQVLKIPAPVAATPSPTSTTKAK